jgi:hypothetical protein
MKPLLKKADAEKIILLQQIDLQELFDIRDQFARLVKNTLREIVVSGLPLENALSVIEKVSDRLEQYTSTYINTSRRILSQTITDLTAKNLKEDTGEVFFQYFGAKPDDKIRNECLIGLGEIKSADYPNAPYFTEEEKERFEAEFGIRWNCRHEFVIITEKKYREAVQ